MHEQPKRPSQSIPPMVERAIYRTTTTIAHKLLSVMPFPAWTEDELIETAIPIEDNREMLKRVALMVRTRLTENRQEIRHVFTMGDGYQVTAVVEFTPPRQAGIVLPSLREGFSDRGQMTPAFQRLKEYAQYWHECDKAAAQVDALSAFMARACTTLNQLKMVWPTVIELVRDSNDVQVQAWVEKFEKASPVPRKTPDLFYGYQEQVEEAEETAARAMIIEKASDEPAQQPGAVTINVSSCTTRPITPPWPVPDWMDVSAKRMAFSLTS